MSSPLWCHPYATRDGAQGEPEGGRRVSLQDKGAERGESMPSGAPRAVRLCIVAGGIASSEERWRALLRRSSSPNPN
eukprot:scaffold130232_cov78-Phaeocystis_antarctica.AAC.1